MAASEEILLELLEEEERRRQAARQLLTAPPPVTTQPADVGVTDATRGRLPTLRDLTPQSPVRLEQPPAPVLTQDQLESSQDRFERAVTRRREDVELAQRSAEAGRARSLVGAFTGGFGGVVAGVPEALEEILTVPFEALGGNIDTAPEDRPGRRIGEAIRRGTRGPVNPEFQEDFSTALASGAGSLVGFAAGVFLGRGAGLFRGATAASKAGLTGSAAQQITLQTGRKFGTTAAGILGALAQGAEAVRDAERNKAEADEIFGAFVGGLGLGATEALPFAAVLNRLDKGTGGLVSRWAQKSAAGAIAVQGVSGAFEEAMQEFIQNAGTNAIAKALFDADREILDAGVAEGSAVGGILGFTMNALFTAIGGRAARRAATGGLDMPPTAGPAATAEAAASGEGAAARPEPEAISLDTRFGAEAVGEPQTPPAEALTPEQQELNLAEEEAAATAEAGAPAVLTQRRDSLAASLEQITDPTARTAVQAELRRVEAEIAGVKPTRRTRKENAILARTPLLDDTADIVIRKLGGLDTDIESDFSGRLKGTELAGRKNLLGVTVADLERPGSGVTLDTVAETFFELGFIAENDQQLASAIIERIEAGETVRNPRSAATEVDLEAEAEQRELDLEQQAAEQAAEGEPKNIQQLTEELAVLDEGEAERISKLDLTEPQRAAVLQDAVTRLTPTEGAEPAATPAETSEFTITDPIGGEGAVTVQLSIREDGTGFITRGEQVIDVTNMVKAGFTAERIIGQTFAEDTSGATVTRIEGAPDEQQGAAEEPTDQPAGVAETEREPVSPEPEVAAGGEPTARPEPAAETGEPAAEQPAAGEVDEGAAVDLETAKEGDTVQVFDIAGRPEQVTVVGRSKDSGVLKVRKADGTEEVLDQGTLSTQDVNDPGFILASGIKSIGDTDIDGRAVSDLTNDELDAVQTRVQEKFDALIEGGQGTTPGGFTMLQNLNALKIEKRRRSEPDAEGAGTEVEVTPQPVEGEFIPADEEGIPGDAEEERAFDRERIDQVLIANHPALGSPINQQADDALVEAGTLLEGEEPDLAEVREQLEIASRAFFQGGQVPLSEVLDEVIEQQKSGLKFVEAEEPKALEAPPETQDVLDQRKAEDEAKAVANASKDTRKSILDSPAKVLKLTGLSQEDFNERARPLIEDYLKAEQELAQATGDDTRLLGLDTVAGDDFFDDLFLASLRVEVEKRADRDQRDSKKTKKAETERGKKFGSTGKSLRRFWEQKRDLANDADASSAERFGKDLTSATARADLFPVETLSKGGTPGLKRYMEYLRGFVTPYKKWASRNGSHFFPFNSFDDDISNIVLDDEHVKTVKAEAVEYINTVTDLAKAIEGATTIGEASDLLVRALGVDEDTELGKRVKKLGGQARWLSRQTAKTDFHPSAVFRVTRLVEEESKPDEEAKGTRAKAMRRPKLRIEDLKRENRDDVRKGQNKTPIELKANFGFADITIGGYVTSKQERLHVNGSFDALSDLADVMKIPVTAISHGGILNYSIGALGHGRHAAHYANEQPAADGVGVVKVINVTNNAGDGTVAHEWGHSLDYALNDTNEEGRRVIRELKLQFEFNYSLDQIDGHISRSLNNLLDGTSWYQGNKRAGPEENARQFLEYTITQMERGNGRHLRRTSFSTEARRSGNSDYWNDPKELLARAFEAWVYDEIAEQGGTSDYLVNDWVSDGQVKNPPFKFTPYPTENERAHFAQLFEILRDGLEVTDAGGLRAKPGTADKIKEIRQAIINRLTEIRDDLPGYIEQRQLEKTNKKRAKELEERRKRDEEAADTQAAIDEALGGDTTDIADTKIEDIHTLTSEQIADLIDDVYSEMEEETADQGRQDAKEQESPVNQDISEDITGEPDPIIVGTEKLVARLQQVFNRNETLNNPAFFKLADEAFGGTRGEGVYTTKDAYDAMELAVNRNVLTLLEKADVPYENAAEWVPFLNDFTARLPTQANRSEEQIKLQMFSTPPPLAYIVGWVANMNANDQVLEPSAGTGSLVVQAQSQGASVIANELNLRRNILLQQLGAQTLSEDAEFINASIKGDAAPSVVLMNPPFSASPRGAKNETKRGARHVESALKSLRPGGRLVAIVGKGMQIGKPTFRKWWDRIGKEYTVRAAIRISGQEYRKFGTTFDNVLIVIDKVAPGGDGISGQVTTVEKVADLVPLLEEIRNGRPTLDQPTPRQQALESGDPQDGGAGGTGTGTPDTTPADDVGGQPTRPGDTQPTGEAAGPGGTTERGGDTGTDDEVDGTDRPGTDDQRDGSATDQGSDREGTGVGEDTTPTDSGVGRDVSVSDLAKAIAKDGVSMADETLKGLVELFGGNKLKSFPAGFDEESYLKSKKHFKQAAEDYKNVVGGIKQLIRRLAEVFGDGGKPIIDRFLNDLKAEGSLATRVSEPAPDPNTADGMINSPTKVDPEPKKPDELTNDQYEVWESTNTLPNAKPHPAEIVETASMAALDLPETDYRPTGMDKLIEDGVISDVQLEPIIHAGDAHTQIMQSEERDDPDIRRGILIGDGTGLGKTRELLGIILDNMNQGRKKAIYITKNQGLIEKMQDDMSVMEMDKKLLLRGKNFPVAGAIQANEGILATSYNTIGNSLLDAERGGVTEFNKGREVQEIATGKFGSVTSPPSPKKSTVSVQFDGEAKVRVLAPIELRPTGIKTEDRTKNEQLIEWVGRDFDGVLIFDEAHLMGSSIQVQTGRGIKSMSGMARAGMDLAAQLPNARVVYATATVASEVNQLAYLDRLGLWGRGTPYADKSAFLDDYLLDGLSGMEQLARDMKQLGVGLARKISYKGVTRERLTHQITDEQTEIYDEIVLAWQAVLNNFETASSDEVTGAGNNSNRQNQISAAIWGFEQRFFKNILLTLKMPTVLAHADEKLANGEAVVIQLALTDAAPQAKSLEAGLAAGLDFVDIDLSQKQQFISLVERYFPTDQYVEGVDSDGRPTWTLVQTTDEEGNRVPLQNPEAVRMKEQLIQNLRDIRIPSGALDMFIQHFGHENVAEFSGRSKQLIINEKGEQELIPKPDNQVALNSFQDDDKQILIFSPAGNTGMDAHADLNRKNQRKRNHYVFDPGWEAKMAMQGIGRDHRSNQKQPPHVILTASNVKSEGRFMSSIAKRLDQLGSLSAGSRETGGGGLFSPEDNLENEYGEAAIRDMFRAILAGRMPDITEDDLAREMGLKDLTDDQGNINDSKLPVVSKFMNRLLATTIARQNIYFDRFFEILTAHVEEAIEDGSYDSGLQNLVAESLEIVHEEVVYSDPRTGAETKYIKVALTDPTRYISFKEAVETGIVTGRALMFFAQNKKTKKISAFFEAPDFTEIKTGNIKHRFRRMDIDGIGFLVKTENVRTEDVQFGKKANWEKLEVADAKELWTQEVADAPTHRTWHQHFITGLIHNIRDRIAGRTQIMRMMTNEGQTIIGRWIPASHLVETLGNLQAAGAKIDLKPAEIIRQILQSDFRYKLSNGWFLQRDTINRENRVRLKGPSGFGSAGNQLKSDGLFTEVVNSETRFYIPTKASEANKVLERVLETRDITEEIPPDIGPAREEGTPYNMRPDSTRGISKAGTELLEISANNAAAAEQRPGEITTLATAINTELIQDHTTTLIGKTVKTGEDLATLAQVYRDPRYETLRYFMTDEDGTILWQTAVSARLPGSTAAFASGEGALDFAIDVQKVREGKHLWIVHNHPSGDSSPSEADITMTRQIKEVLNGLRLSKVTVDHVVIDSNNYSHMQALVLPKGQVQVTTRPAIKRNFGRDRLLEPAIPHPLLNRKAETVQEVADIGAALQNGSGWIAVVGVTARSHVRALGEVHETTLKNTAAMKKEVLKFARATGSDQIYLVGANPEMMFTKNIFKKAAQWTRDLIELGVVTDVIGTDGLSLRAGDSSVVPSIDFELGLNVKDQTFVVREQGDGKYESDIIQKQKEIVEKTRKGQPLDRLLRFMFTGFGLFEDQILNRRGEFKLGIVALERVKRLLTTAKFSDTGAFRWMNGYMEHARAGLIDRYGVPEDLIQRGFEATAQQRALLREGLEFLNRLFEAGVSSLQEAVIIQKMLTGVDLDGNEALITKAEWEGIAGEIRAAVDSLGLEAVSLGLISRESYERNHGTYLHRVYTEHELGKDKTLSRFMGRLMAGRKHAIKGDALRGRGIFQEVTQERLLKDISKADRDKFELGLKQRKSRKPDESLLTKKFRILDLFDEGTSPDNQTLRGVENVDNPKRLKKRLIIPADKEIPARLANFEDRGVYEVRRISGNKLVLWRDFTKAERVQMGEILDARYTIAKTYHVLAQDLVSARFFKDISENKEWTWQGTTAPPNEIVAPKNTALRHYVGFEWILVPTDTIGQKSKVKKWGALAGKYIRAEIWKDLNELDAMNQKGPWASLLKQWKLNKTARHPVVHMNNVISNLTLMDIIDVRARDLWRGIKEYNDRGELYELARTHGAFGQSYIDQEIKDEILGPVLRDMSKEAKQGMYEEGSFLKKLRFVDQYSRMASEGIQRLGKAIGDFDRASREWYRTEDEVFRMATFIRKLEQGEDPHEAAALAREQFLNYDIRAPWVNTARRSVLPFIAYTYRAVPAIIDAMVRRPWKFAKYALLAELANAFAYAVSDGDEEWERASLRPEVRGSVWVGGAPRMMRMPVNDKQGNPIFLDIRRWIPAGDVFDVAPNNPLPIPAWLHFGGPIMIAGEMMLNRSAFTGDAIVDPNIDTLGDKTKKYGAFLYRSTMPSAPWVYESWYWQKIARAATGGRDALGRDISLPGALLSATGIKATGHDVELNFEYRRREFDRTERALRYAMRLNGRDLHRGLINAKEHGKIENDLLDKLLKLNENRAQTFAPLLRRRQ